MEVVIRIEKFLYFCNMDKVKNLLFDLGGVIMDIRRENAVVALEALGLKDADRLLGDYVQNGIFRSLEEGNISPEAFDRAVRNYLPDNGKVVSDDAINRAFMKFLTGIPVHRLRTLEELHKTYKIYMLSNTNIIMWEGEIKQDFTVDGHDIDYYFDGIVTSFEAHSVKPDPGIFRYTIDKLSIVPEETLYLDDSELNLEAGARFGFLTLHVPTDTEFADLLKCRL